MQEVDLTDRKTFIGSSDAASILGVSPWKSLLQLYKEKTGEYQEDITPEKQKLFNRGKKFEPLILDMLIEDLSDRGHDIEVISRNERLCDPEYQFIASETDMVLRIDGDITSAEAKSVNGFAAKLWGDAETDDFPIYYQCQTMHDMMVKGRNRCVVAALIGTDDLRIHWIDRDEEIIQALRTKEIAFWEMVQNRTPPKPTTHDDIKLLYKRDYGASVDVDDEISEYFSSLVMAKEQQKELESKIDLITTKIKSFMGDAAVLTANGRPLLTWKNNKDSSKTDWKAAFYDLVGKSVGISKADLDEIINNTTKTVPGARVFRIK